MLLVIIDQIYRKRIRSILIMVLKIPQMEPSRKMNCEAGVPCKNLSVSLTRFGDVELSEEEN